MTYSVVAVDPATGECGVAVQSHWFNVAAIVPWARSGVGAVATQAQAEPSYGSQGLDLLAAGTDPATALPTLLQADPGREHRQVAILDQVGRSAVHTGSRCIPHASHVVGDGWSVQGNLLTSARVIEAMAETMRTATGAMPDRLIATLEAAESAGGDLRGRQSAAIRIAAPASASAEPLGIELCVVDHDDPVPELKRLVRLDQAYRALKLANAALDRGDEAEAAHQYDLALAAATASGQSHEQRRGTDQPVPNHVPNPEVHFWVALGLTRMSREPEATAMLQAVLQQAPQFREMLSRMAPLDLTAASLAQT